jgi:hypothetical protein
MIKLVRSIHGALELAGFDVRKTLRFLKGYGKFKRGLAELRRQMAGNHDFALGKRLPILGEDQEVSGIASGAYFHQDLLVARKIYEAKPIRHVDVGSRVDGFVAHVAVYRPIEVIDIRRQDAAVKNIIFRQCDMMNLPAEMEGYCDSLSALHSIEHFGLGRYGDAIDYRGHLRAIDAMHRMLMKGGRLYFSVPIGPQRIEFNAHRVFDVGYLLGVFQNAFRLQEFSFVDDSGVLVEDAPLEESAVKANFGCWLGCGIFQLEKM